MSVQYSPAQLARVLRLPEPTAEQAAVIGAPLGPMAVIAGAGSGKSETMAARLVWLVANGMVRPDRVLGLTFTRKAAAELADRVRSRLDRLRRAGLGSDDAAGEPGTPGTGSMRGAGSTPGTGDTPGEWNRAGTGTAPGTGSTPGAGYAPGEWNGAGTGTTPGTGSMAGTGSVPRMGSAAGAGAVRDLRGDPGDAEPGPWSGDPVIGTYHAYAGRLVSDHALREGLEPSQRLITPALSWQMAASIVAAYDGPMDDISWTPQTVTAAVLQLAGDLAEHLREPADITAVGEWLRRRYDALPGKPSAAARRILDSQRAREQMLPLIIRYAAGKAAREELDHGDQVAIAARIADRHPEVGVAERGRYQVVLLDEYQDTSHAQLVLLRALFSGGHPVTAVGDPCQSIYGWRGASAGNLRRFTTDFPARSGDPAPVRLLSTSFRNAGHVLDAAAVLQRELREAAPDVPLLVPAPDRAARGTVTCALLPAVTDEAEWVASQAARLLTLPPGSAPDSRPWPDGRAAGVRPSDIAVLCRKRSQFTALRRALERRGIPCEVVGLGGLLSVPEVQDVVATLRVLHDAGASDALARLLTGPRWRIGPRDLVALGRRARDLARGLDTTPAEPAGRVAPAGPAASAGPAGSGTAFGREAPAGSAASSGPAASSGSAASDGPAGVGRAAGRVAPAGPAGVGAAAGPAAPAGPAGVGTAAGPVAPAGPGGSVTPAGTGAPVESTGAAAAAEPYGNGGQSPPGEAPLPSLPDGTAVPGKAPGHRAGPPGRQAGLEGGQPAAWQASVPEEVVVDADWAHDDEIPWPQEPSFDEDVPWPEDDDWDPPAEARPPGTADTGTDALAEAVTDLTSESGSLVEALDDLGDPAGYSAAGYARLQALAAETRRLRGHVTRPIADLIAEVERTLSLDIEVAARPGAAAGTARADLDKFTDVAATFAGEQPEPTLGAFLAYLTAAQQEEFGLETGRVGEADTVKLLTVHAAKGLQWPAIFVPGLAAGDKSQVFPARPRQSTRWTDNPRLIPFSLRGDLADLPPLDGLDAESLAAFTAACADRDLAEERRLAYVAATRAAFWLGCSGYWWGEGTVPLGPSVFLTEARAACEAGAGTVSAWAAPPADEADNPLLAAVDEADWPATPAGRHHEAIRSARQLVEEAMRKAPAADSAKPRAAAKRRRKRADDSQAALFTDEELAGTASAPPGAQAHAAPLTEEERELVAAWELDAGLLLAERERQQRRGGGPVPVMLPARLSVSALVALARDPNELARQVRRPMPQPPARQARRGTEFHRWLEERFGQQRLIDDEDLFADPEAAPDASLAQLREKFEAGQWGDRWPREVEVPFDTLIGDRQVRGRIDAVFADADGFDVVDWKTGQPPRTRTERDAVAVQLAAYRLAWAALAGVPLEKVRAAFYYVRDDLTVRPADLLDEAGLVALIDRVPVAG